jgi:hypothetical protein
VFVCKDLLTSPCLSMAQSCPPMTRNLGSYCVLAHQTINTVICKTFQHHKEPSQDRWCSGRFYRKQQLGVCANRLLLSPFPRLCVTEHADTCDTEADAVSFTGYTTGCFAGDIRCGFTGDGLSEINLSITVEAGFLMGAVSRNVLLLITYSCRHRAEICPQHTEQSQHTLQLLPNLCTLQNQ